MSQFEGNNFISNNFFWFTGVIEDIEDPLEMGRVRTRCFGYHTDDKEQLPTSSLPWAHVMMPVTSASCSGIGTSATGILPGSWVVGFFRDGNACQDPLVIGTLPSVTPAPADREKGFCDPTPQGNPREDKAIDNPKGSTEEYLSSKSYISKYELREKTKLPYTDVDSPGGVPMAVPPREETLLVANPDEQEEVKDAATGKITTPLIPHDFMKMNSWIQPDQDDICEPSYPNCHTTETKSGHTIELDDSMGANRILHRHASGTFDEIDNSGTKTTVVIGDGYEVTFKDKNVNVKGFCNLTVDEDVRTRCKNYYLECLENMYVNVHGSVHRKVGMSEYLQVVKDKKENIGGLLTTRIGKNEKRTIGADKGEDDSPVAFGQDLEVFGDQNIQINEDKIESIDGIFDLGVAKDASMTFSGKWNVTTSGDLTINSQSILDVDATGKITIDTQNDMDLHAGTSGTVDIDGPTAINLN
jgi:hypothetical protein